MMKLEFICIKGDYYSFACLLKFGELHVIAKDNLLYLDNLWLYPRWPNYCTVESAVEHSSSTVSCAF